MNTQYLRHLAMLVCVCVCVFLLPQPEVFLLEAALMPFAWRCTHHIYTQTSHTMSLQWSTANSAASYHAITSYHIQADLKLG